jgi:hypothetical protein
MNFTLTNKQYDVLKWLISVVIPALIVLLSVIMGALNWEHTEVFLTIAVAIETFLGTIFKVSDHNYKKELDNNG